MKFEKKLTGSLARFVIRFHKWIPLGAIILAVLCIMAASNIKMKTEMKDMLPENNPKINTYLELNELFSGGSTVMITINWMDTTKEPDKKQMIACAEQYAAKVESNKNLMQYVRAINLKLEKDFIIKWSLMLQKAGDLQDSKNTFAKLNLLPFLTTINDSFEKTYTGEEAEEEIDTRRQEGEAVGMLGQFESFFVILREYLEVPDTQPAVVGKNLAETFIYGESYNFNYDNTMLMFTISPNFPMTDIEKMIAMMTEIKSIQKELQPNYPNLEIGYTGEVAIGSDEMDALGFDLMVPAIVALFIILLLFIFSFTQIRAVVFVIIVLIFGIIFTFGFLGITIAEINMMTSMMAVLLVGLGVDYGIQFVANFNTFRSDGLDRDQAITNTFHKAGMGIILAALTTAIGFFVLAATGTKIFSQFGVVMGMGIISCLVAMITLLPAILYWWGRKDFKKTKIPKINFHFLTALGKLTNKYMRTTIIAAIIMTVGLLLAAIFLNKFEYDLMRLEPQDMPSIVQYKKIMEKYNMNPFSSLVIADSVEEARNLTEKLEKEKLVAQISSVSYLLPPTGEQDERLKAIAEIRNMDRRYEVNYQYQNRIEEFMEQVNRLEDNVIEIGQLSAAGLGEDNLIVKKRNAMIHEVLGAEIGEPGKEVFLNLIKVIEKDKETAAKKLSALDIYFAKEMDSIVTSMSLIQEKMGIEDLPEAYIKSYFDKDKTKTLIIIYPEKYVIDHLDYMKRFNDKLNKISPKITGTSQIIVEWMDELTTATPRAGLYIFIAVLFFIIITFRNIRYTIVAIIPLVIGMVWMLGFFPLFGFKLDMMNFLLIPLIIGMGIDYGIHLAHRHKMEGNIENTYRFTGKGVFLSAVTTMIGFGSLGLIGKYPAIASMGAILFFGIAACLLTSFIILPALLGLIKKEN